MARPAAAPEPASPKPIPTWRFLPFVRLAGADLRSRAIDFKNISRGSFIGAKLTGAVITATTARRACMDDANLRGAHIERSMFMRARFRNAQASFMTVQQARFSHADFTSATLTRAQLADMVDLTHAIFDGAMLLAARLSYAPNASFVGANANACHFENATLTNAVFRNASLVHANLTNADLTGADITGANLTGAKVFAHQLLATNGWQTATLDPGLAQQVRFVATHDPLYADRGAAR